MGTPGRGNAWDETPEEAVWVPDEVYVNGWRDARDALDELCLVLGEVLGDVGVAIGHAAVVTPSTDGDGSGLVRYQGRATPEQLRAVVEVLRRGAGALPEQRLGG